MEGLTLFRAVLTVLGVLLLAFWWSRLLGRQWARSSGSGNMQVIEHIQVGQNQKILLLKAGGHNYLVGVSPAGIRLLTEVEGDFEAVAPPAPATLELPFRAFLEKCQASHGKKGEETDE